MAEHLHGVQAHAAAGTPDQHRFAALRLLFSGPGKREPQVPREAVEDGAEIDIDCGRLLLRDADGDLGRQVCRAGDVFLVVGFFAAVEGEDGDFVTDLDGVDVCAHGDDGAGCAARPGLTGICGDEETAVRAMQVQWC